jgi:hypothetical protein
METASPSPNMEVTNMENYQAINESAQAIIGNKMYINRGFEREMYMGNTKIRVKSIFNGYTTLDNAIKNIVMKKIYKAV